MLCKYANGWVDSIAQLLPGWGIFYQGLQEMRLQQDALGSNHHNHLHTSIQKVSQQDTDMHEPGQITMHSNSKGSTVQ